jgi:hypothetical protein
VEKGEKVVMAFRWHFFFNPSSVSILGTCLCNMRDTLLATVSVHCQKSEKDPMPPENSEPGKMAKVGREDVPPAILPE